MDPKDVDIFRLIPPSSRPFLPQELPSLPIFSCWPQMTKTVKSGTHQAGWLPDVPGGWTTRRIGLGLRDVVLSVPATPDRLLDDPAVLQASEQSDYMPYWAWLWPASEQMARLVARHPWIAGTRTLEIGAGLGLVGIAGLVAGLDVTFSDYDADAATVSQMNAIANGLEHPASGNPHDPASSTHVKQASPEGLVLDWRNLDAVTLDPFPVMLGCDVIYEPSNHEPVLNVIDRLLCGSGECWLGDPGRRHVPAFCRLAHERGYNVEVRNETGEQEATLLGIPTVASLRFRLLILTRR